MNIFARGGIFKPSNQEQAVPWFAGLKQLEEDAAFFRSQRQELVDTPPEYTKLKINISNRTAENMKWLKSVHGILFTDQVSRAITLYKWIKLRQSCGDTVIIKDNRGRYTEYEID